jgi:enoyl-CoA hydratase
MNYNNLLVEVENGIAVVTINRPKSLNALNSETLAELDKCFAELETNDEVKVVILTGSGDKSFVAGADISEMVNGSAPEGRTMGLLARVAFKRMEDMEKPTIAAVNGFALGGGCEISMACDITVASDNAKFGQPECGLGILPGFGGTQRLPRLIGKKRAKELIFTCDMIDADEAYRIGLANHVVPQAELIPYCKDMAKRIMANGPFSVSLAKQAINIGLDTDIDSGLKLEANLFGLSFATQDKKEGMTAFLEKRKDKKFIGK